MKKTLFYFYGALLAFMFWGLASCTGPQQIEGTYKVTGSPGAVANIVYAVHGLGGNSQANNQTLPWQTNFTAYETEGDYQGTYVFLSALNNTPGPSGSSSSVTITILEDNQIFQAPNYEIGNGNAVTLFGYF